MKDIGSRFTVRDSRGSVGASRVTCHVFPSAGFTLFETMLAVALMALLAGGLFALVQGSIQATTELHQKENRERELMGFVELCQRAFRTLPASASLQSQIHEEDGRSFPEIVFGESPQAFSWGEASAFPGSVILAVRPQIGGLVNVSLLHRENAIRLGVGSSQEVESSQGLVLVSDLQKVEWRFYDPRMGTWMEGWRDIASHPSLVELTLTPAGNASPIRSVFWLPPLQKN